MLRLFGFLVTLSIVVGAVLMLDYNTVRKQAVAAEQPVPDFRTYLDGLQPRIVSLVFSSDVDAGPSLATDLAQMLPRAPDGWTLRPAERDDIQSFLPKEKGKLEGKAAALIESLVKPKGPKGSNAVALVYEKGDRKIIVKAIRYPDSTFGDPAAHAALLKDDSPFRQSNFLRVRGLDVMEDTLPDGMRGRLFSGDVGGQIRIWILAPKRTSDEDLLPFFETLDVRAMNAAVIDREDGLGEIPVMLLVSDLDEAGLAAYEADFAARASARETRRAEVRATLATTAPTAAEGSTDKPAEVNCTTGTGGIKRCTVDG